MKTTKLTSIFSLVLLLIALPLFSQTVSTVVGGDHGDGGAAAKASIDWPFSLARDASGNLYVAEFYGHRIRKVTPSGTITTYAGTGIGGYNGDGISANTAELYYPSGITFDPAGNLIVADGGNNRVRSINASGIISTIAGTGVVGYTGNGGPATAAMFNQPWGVTYDSSGNLYITDIGNCVVRIVNTGGIINAFAGNGTCGFGGDGGPATSANLTFPRGMVKVGGDLYIADTDNYRVRKVNAAGIITTFAGNGVNGFTGDGGLATDAEIARPRALAFHNQALYISNAGKQRVRFVTLSTGIINTYVGSAFGYDGDGNPLLSSEFTGIAGILFDPTGTLIIADGGNGRVRKTANGVMKTIAGGAIGDGKIASAGSVVGPEAIAFDKSGNYYIAEANGNRVRKVSAAGVITTIAGTGVNGSGGDGGLGTAAQLSFPLGVAADSSGNVFIADDFNNVIREVNTSGIINTFATDVDFSGLGTMAIDGSNNLYVVDQGTCVIWKISPLAVVTVVAGVEFSCGYNGDNISALTAQLNTPVGVALDSRGNIYIADSSNNRVRKVNTSGTITTIVGDGNCGFTGDGGLGTSAEVCFPEGVAVTSSGTVYIADTSNLRIRKLAAGIITTYAGTGISGFNGDGPALSTNFDDPVAVTFNNNKLYMVDDATERVRRIQ